MMIAAAKHHKVTIAKGDVKFAIPAAVGGGGGGDPGGTAEVTTIDFTNTDAIAGGEYLLLPDVGGMVAVWFTRDGNGSAPSAGYRQVLVTFGATGSDEDRANDCGSLNGDGAWSATVSGTVVTVTDLATGARTDASAETSLTTVTTITQGS